ncbi:MAG: hypothetical protein SGJ20_18565 [Planctomycetota bacterium]|nr:hypothetical protein [Planctomycetota bacterium]
MAALRENSPWSISLGRWGGLNVRLHASFLVCAALIVFVFSRTEASQVAELSILTLGILFASVLLHELGHVVVAVRFGGRVDRIMISPLGSFQLPQVAPQSELPVALAGPAVNLLMVLMTAPLLVMAGAKLQDFLLTPLDPQKLVVGGEQAWLVALRLTCWINSLLLLNLFPAYPLDAGHALAAMLRPIFGSRPAVLIVATSAMLLAAGLVLMACLLPADNRLIPTWLLLALFAVFLYFNARYQIESLRAADAEDDLLGYDFSEGYTSLERPLDELPRARPSLFAQWLQRRRTERQQRMRQQELDEERQVDVVLIRLKEYGLEGLSSQERSLLNRVSKRYRNRQRSN